ncbi:hypothetical protein PsYK624_003770 [Phanerochaete sordida]|uniref:Uncharacterized protein n=1 Tax=Phanerochaete sordida TaxID=48140 RepID=A0A9P3FXB9_9APHY|nr:hypothetical protein PsYK624_003770 [Phanerochaete sordida]
MISVNLAAISKPKYSRDWVARHGGVPGSNTLLMAFSTSISARARLFSQRLCSHNRHQARGALTARLRPEPQSAAWLGLVTRLTARLAPLVGCEPSKPSLSHGFQVEAGSHNAT